jgi:hypothetical protein
MTLTAALLLALLAGAEETSSAASPEAPTPGAAEERQRQAAVAELAPAKAKMLELFVGKDTKAALRSGSLLRWSNPSAGSVYGEVFLWTVEERPAAVASIYRWYHPYRDANVEFVSLCRQPVSAQDGNEAVWQSQSPGVVFSPLDGAPKPSLSPAVRLTQMKALAREFSAELLDERGGEPVTRQLRLLNQPLHRYASPASGVADGALFAFVEGTDPEAWLLMEATQDQGQLTWSYALARMNADALQIRHQRRVIESWPAIHQAWRNRKAPYTFYSFDPSRVPLPQKESP